MYSSMNDHKGTHPRNADSCQEIKNNKEQSPPSWHFQSVKPLLPKDNYFLEF